MQLYTFEKKVVPEDISEKEEFCVSLSRYGVSLKQYVQQLQTPTKKRSGEGIAPDPRRSPRLMAASQQEQVDVGGVSRNLFGN